MYIVSSCAASHPSLHPSKSFLAVLLLICSSFKSVLIMVVAPVQHLVLGLAELLEVHTNLFLHLV